MRLVASIALAMLLGGSMMAQTAGKIFVVRHAEKKSADPDTPLSDVGSARAKCLGETLKDAGIKRIFVTQYVRTRQTAEQVFRDSHAQEDTMDAKDTGPLQVAAIAAARDGNVLIVGHSNTVPDIVLGLGAPKPVVPDSSYDQLFIVDLNDPQHSVALHYCPAPEADKKEADKPQTMAK